MKNDEAKTAVMKPKNMALKTAHTVAATVVCVKLKGMFESSTGRNSDRMAAKDVAKRNKWRFLMAVYNPENGFVDGEKRMDLAAG